LLSIRQRRQVTIIRKDHTAWVYGQNGNKSRWQQVKTATYPNNTYSFSEAYMINRMLHTYRMACNC